MRGASPGRGCRPPASAAPGLGRGTGRHGSTLENTFYSSQEPRSARLLSRHPESRWPWVLNSLTEGDAPALGDGLVVQVGRVDADEAVLVGRGPHGGAGHVHAHAPTVTHCASASAGRPALFDVLIHFCFC